MLAKLEFNEIRLSSLFPLQAERRRYLFHIFMETEVCHTVNRVLSPLITWGTGVRLAWLRRIKRHPSGVFTAPPKSYMERQAALNMISHNSNYNKRIPSSSINIGIVIICAGGPFPRLERPPPSPSPFSLLSLSIDTHIHTATDRESPTRPDSLFAMLPPLCSPLLYRRRHQIFRAVCSRMFAGKIWMIGNNKRINSNAAAEPIAGSLMTFLRRANWQPWAQDTGDTPRPVIKLSNKKPSARLPVTFRD